MKWLSAQFLHKNNFWSLIWRWDQIENIFWDWATFMDTKGNVSCQWSSSTNNSGSFFCSYDEDENTLWILVSFIEALSLQALFYSFAILFLLQFFFAVEKVWSIRNYLIFFARHTPMVWNYFSMSYFFVVHIYFYEIFCVS